MNVKIIENDVAIVDIKLNEYDIKIDNIHYVLQIDNDIFRVVDNNKERIYHMNTSIIDEYYINQNSTRKIYLSNKEYHKTTNEIIFKYYL